jgi:alkylhydroperoxidase family enzyme
MTRLPLLDALDIGEEHRAFVDAIQSAGGWINLYRAIAHSPEALRRFYQLLASLWGSSIGARTREIAILSVLSASGAPYPLAWHLLDAKDAGLAPHEIRAIAAGDAASALPPDGAAIVEFARALTVDARVDDRTYQAVAKFFDQQQMVELTMVVGLYRMVACVANALEVELDDALRPGR